MLILTALAGKVGLHGESDLLFVQPLDLINPRDGPPAMLEF